MITEYPSRNEWIDGHNAPKTKEKAHTVLKLFDQYLSSKEMSEEKFFSEMRDANSTIQSRIIKEIGNRWLDEGRSPSTVSIYRHKLLTWFEENDIVIPKTKLRRIAKIPKQLTEMKYTPDASHILKIISKQKSLEVATFFITLAATGMRQGELRQVRLDEIDMQKRMIRIPAHRTKTRTERITFFTPEARHYLKRHIKDKDLKLDDQLFSHGMNDYHWHMQKANHDLGHADRFATGRYKMSMHRLRAYAKQCIRDSVSNTFAEVILGHIEGNKTYDIGNINKMKKDYEKAVPALTLDKTRQFEDLLERQNNNTDENSIILSRMKALENELERLRHQKD